MSANINFQELLLLLKTIKITLNFIYHLHIFFELFDDLSHFFCDYKILALCFQQLNLRYESI